MFKKKDEPALTERIDYKYSEDRILKELQEYINVNLTKVKVEKTPPPQPVRDERPVHIIDLLSSSEGEVSEDSSSDTETGDETEKEGEIHMQHR